MNTATGAEEATSTTEKAGVNGAEGATSVMKADKAEVATAGVEINRKNSANLRTAPQT